MPAPQFPLYIDTPNGTARVWIRIVGDQSDNFTSNVYEEADWKPFGESTFQDMEEGQASLAFGPLWMNAPSVLREILTLSGVTGPASDAEMVQWFLSKPKAEVDVWLIKWAREKIFPHIGVWLGKVLGNRLGTASSPVGGYSNLEEAFNSIWVNAKVSVVNGVVSVTSVR